MYHSIIFIDPSTNKEINTYDDWFLAPQSRPVIAMPDKKTYYIDIPGASGSIDMSETLTGYPIYGNRTGSLSFFVLNALNGLEVDRWNIRYDEISNFLHGRYLKMILEDEPNYFYSGRIFVSDWNSKENNSEITFDYELEPYKWSVEETTDSNWLWDPFDFETGDTQRYTKYTNLVVNSPSTYKTYTFSKDDEGYAPVTPIFRVSSMTTTFSLRFVNTALNIDVTYPLVVGDNEFLDCIITNTADWKFYIKGAGTLSVVYRKGRL